ncbi:MAG: hypothetical protein DRQ88_10575 [Epsilonproteobacteria bacterium]|nr:MAG: hypothetical protein DRQ88_10575 [Campylobacterota bacterium]RLA65636.1 MAG: hypothetical protein DRQ89_01180 [Campylobacterota bacterium]
MATTEEIIKKRGALANIHKVFLDFPQGVAGHFALYEKIMLEEDLPLSREIREFIAVEVSKANECPYCITHHSEAYKNFAQKLDRGKAELLREFSQVSSKEPWKASIFIKKFKEAGFSHPQYLHAVMVASYFNMANRLAFSLSLEIEPDFEKLCN